MAYLWVIDKENQSFNVGLESKTTKAGIVIPSVRFLGLHPRPSVQARGRAVGFVHPRFAVIAVTVAT